MENTLINKQAFFALYWGQEVIKEHNGYKFKVLGDTIYWDDALLELKPLSEISDEDVNIMVSIFRGKPLKNCIIERVEDKTFITVEYNREGKIDNYCDYDYITMYLWIRTDECTISNRWGYVRGNGTGITYNQTDNILKCYDYLRSKGYALPYLSLTVSDLVEFGWIKLSK